MFATVSLQLHGRLALSRNMDGHTRRLKKAQKTATPAFGLNVHSLYIRVQAYRVIHICVHVERRRESVFGESATGRRAVSYGLGASFN